MGMWDNWNEPQPVEPETPTDAEPTTVEPEPTVEAAPEPVEPTSEPAKPEEKTPAKTPAKRKGGEKVSKQLVGRVRDALARLDDAGVRHAVAVVSGRDEEDVDALAVAVLDGTMGEPAALLVALHDETDGGERARIAMTAFNDKKSNVFKSAVRMVAALDPTAAESMKGRDFNQAFDLADAAHGMDVEALRSLA